MDYYESILAGSFQNAVYGPSHETKGWLWLTNGKRFKLPQWKFHVSVHQGQVRDAWNLIANYLINHGDDFKAKVAGPELVSRFSDPAHRQAGKMIAIYAVRDVRAEVWKGILKDIEELLRADEIRPGCVVKSDRKIPGSLYIYYRNDGGKKPFSADEMNKVPPQDLYNPRHAPDPYSTFEIAA